MPTKIRGTLSNCRPAFIHDYDRSLGKPKRTSVSGCETAIPLALAQLRGDDFLKKAHDFRDAEAQCAVAKQSRIKLVQVSRALKENIGGALALGGYPVVGHVLQKIGHQRIDLLGITVEKSRPIQRTKAV